MAFPGTYNINYYEGDTYEFVIYPKTANGAVFDLTGYTSSFSIATTRGPNPSLSFNASAEVDPTKTFITCKILPAVGRQLVAGTQYVYDVQVSSGISNVYTLLTGNISVTADITGA